jgi:hypothetical protein
VGIIEKLERVPLVQMGQVLFLGNRNLSQYVAHHKQDSHSKKWGSVKLYFLCSSALKIKRSPSKFIEVSSSLGNW